MLHPSVFWDKDTRPQAPTVGPALPWGGGQRKASDLVRRERSSCQVLPTFDQFLPP